MEKLIDTDALEGGKFHSIEDWTPVEVATWQRGWNDAIDAIISNVSTVDAEEVVRCKDCRYWGGHKYSNSHETDFVCRYWESDGLMWNDFCSCGERREDGKAD